jgi:hypothetical protein
MSAHQHRDDPRRQTWSNQPLVAFVPYRKRRAPSFGEQQGIRSLAHSTSTPSRPSIHAPATPGDYAVILRFLREHGRPTSMPEFDPSARRLAAELHAEQDDGVCQVAGCQNPAHRVVLFFSEPWLRCCYEHAKEMGDTGA